MKQDLPVLLFDWDGVVVDSNAWKWGGAWSEVFSGEQRLYELMQRVLEKDTKKQLSRYKLVDAVFEEASSLGITPLKTKEEYLSTFSNAVQDGIIRIGLFPGVPDVLKELKERGHRMYVISATLQEDLEVVAKELGVQSFFVSLHGAPLSKKDHANSIKGELGPENIYVVIGDGDGDRKLAEYLECRFIGVRNEWNRWGLEEEFETIQSVKDLPDLLGW